MLRRAQKFRRPVLWDARSQDRRKELVILSNLVKDTGSPQGEGWWNWYVVKRGPDAATLIGVVGLKGWPEATGSVQFGCAFLPEFQDHGYGTETVDGLVSWVLSQPKIERITAETPVGNRPSASVLRKLGFSQIHSDDEELLRFEKRRPQS